MTEFEKNNPNKLLEKLGIKEKEVLEKITLDDLYKVYKKHLHIEDLNRLDCVLAVAVSQKINEGIRLWLIIVGASGDMKSVQINALLDWNTYLLHNLTSKTLVNGYKDKEKYPDLAPKLDGKILLIPDMAQILKLPPNEKAELWGQLRDLYDGFAGKHSGMGSTQSYKNLKVTLIAASTPAIDAQILVHQDLGTRELIYRTSGNTDKNALMDICFRNEEIEEEVIQELRKITVKFLEGIEIIREKEISTNTLETIKMIASYISLMRSTAEFDNYTNELRNFVYPEEPTRIAKQLKRLFVCLKSLDKNYSDERALQIIWHVAQSSAFPIRIKIFDLLKEQQTELSSSQVAEKLSIGKGTAKRDLSVLEALKFVKCRKEQMSNFPDRFYEYWKINPSEEIRYLSNIPSKFNFLNEYKYTSHISSDGLQKENYLCSFPECSKKAIIIDKAGNRCYQHRYELSR